MWFGRLVPLFSFPSPKAGGLESNREEERLLPLPADLCVGMNVDEGTALYVTYGVNPNAHKLNTDKDGPEWDPECDPQWGNDLAGWIAIAPFPPQLLHSPRLQRLGVHVKNKAGAFREGVTKRIAEAKGVFLAMEILGSGDMGGLVFLQPEDKDKEVVDIIDKNNPHIRGTRKPEIWERGRELIDELFPRLTNNNGGKERLPRIDWAVDRRVLIRGHQITVPYGEFWRQVRATWKFKRKNPNGPDSPETKNKIGESNGNNPQENQAEGKEPLHIEPPRIEDLIKPVGYCLLARDMELPVLIALFPSRPLFRVQASLNANQDFGPKVGSGMIDRIVKELASHNVNIWHIKNTYRSLMFSRDSEDEQDYQIRGVEADVTIIASVPPERRNDSADSLSLYLRELRERILHTRHILLDEESSEESSKPDASSAKADSAADRIDNLRKDIERLRVDIAEGLKEWKSKKSGYRYDFAEADALNDFKNSMERRLEELAKNVIEPEFISKMEITGPALFRCFFSHSVRPEYDEKDYIDRIKLLLESEVFEVIEGEFSLGMSTEDLSRGRIRCCNLFVSLLWPRNEFRTDKGEFLGSDWVIHEESFAIGHGLPVYRIREKSVAPPRYEHDRVDFPFTRGDLGDWENLEQKFRQEIRQLVLQSLLGTGSTTAKRKVSRAGETTITHPEE